MRKYLSLILLLLTPVLVWGQCPGGRCPAPKARPTAKSAKVPAVPRVCVNASVKVVNRCETATYGGSGTVIFKDKRHALVLTCKHLFTDGTGELSVVIPGRGEVKARLVALDPKADLAALTIDAAIVKAVVPVASRSAKKGELAWQVGYPHGVGPHRRGGLLEGIVGTYHRIFKVPCLGLRFNTVSGDSGSGVFRCKDRQLVGVVWGGGRGKGSATGTKEIKRFLKSRRCVKKFPGLARKHKG